ncbi:MAG: DUF2922 domain-containing protein [Bacillota bacterium]
MAAVETLQMSFINAEGRTTSISVIDPKEGLTPAEVEAAMQEIVDKNIFATSGGALVSIASARLISRDVTILVES